MLYKNEKKLFNIFSATSDKSPNEADNTDEPAKKVLRRRSNVNYKDLTDSIGSDQEEINAPESLAFSIFEDPSTCKF